MTAASRPFVVIGDTLLDIDLEGSAGRLAPDAPVPVLDDLVEHPRPGGAGLAALLAARDGHRVVLVTALGADEPGRRVERLLADASQPVEVRRLRYDGPTAVKKRVRAGGQSLLRLDAGSGPGRFDDEVDHLELRALLSGAAAVLVADYGRGVTAVPALRAQLAGMFRASPLVPLVWDPHPSGTDPLPGTWLATPNAAEAHGFVDRLDGPTVSGDGLAAIRQRAEELVRAWRARAVAVTLGSRGALLSYGAGAPALSPAPSVSGGDPCGAGDRFAVTAATSLAAGRLPSEAVQDAVLAASDYVGAGGPASLRADPDQPPGDPPRPSSAAALAATVTAGGGTVVATGGCFDLLHAGHVATLRAARALGDCLIVCLNSDDSVRRLKGPTRPLVPAADRRRLLEAFEFVDAVVVFDEDTPVEVLRTLRPQVWTKGGDYAGADDAQVPELAALREWGGQAVVLPYLSGRSTTELVRSAARRPNSPPEQNTPKENAR